MYLKDCRVENSGPIKYLDITLPFNEDGSPKPVVLVGENGSGKSIMLSYIVDALIELAKMVFSDIVPVQADLRTPFYRSVSENSRRTNSSYCVALLEFADEKSTYSYIEKIGELDRSSYLEPLGGRFKGVADFGDDNLFKAVWGDKNNLESFFNRIRCASLLQVLAKHLIG